jgi:large repetitive protein
MTRDAQGNTEASFSLTASSSSTPKSSFSDYVLRCVRGGDNTTVRNVADVGNVAVMEVTGDMNADASDCMVYTPIRQAVASEFIRTHGDNYDFLVFLTTFDFAMPPGHDGFYLEAKNDTFGIGTPIIDRTGDFGSLGKLQGTIDLGNLMPLAANPYGPKLDPTVTMLNHEIMHRWGVHALFKDATGALNEGLIGETNSHWSYLLDTKGSVMYGNAWKDNRDGTFTSTAVETGYSPLDLYLMGMIQKDQVPPMLLIDNPAIDKMKLPELGATITGTARTVTMDQIVAALGERNPDAANSQKQFNVGFVLLTRPGVPVGNAPAAIETLRSTWAGRFAAFTQGKASVANVPAALTLTIDTPADRATITGPDVTVSGTIINTTGAETGVIVNGDR